MTQLVSYKTEYGFKTALIVEEGRKWMTVLLMHPDVRAHKVPVEERKFMQPLAAKKPGKVFRRNLTETSTQKVRRFLRGVA